MDVEWGHIPMRQHVLQVGKSQDMYHGIMGMCRDPMGTQGWCITSSGVKGRDWRMRRGARWLEKGDTGEIGGQEDFGCSWWKEAAEECRGHYALLPWPWVSSLSATPPGTWRMAWWNRGVRIESLSSFSATFAQSLPRNLPGTHLTERLLEIIDWQEALTRREEKELDIRLFWKILSHNSNIPGWRLKCTWYVFYFLHLFWHLWVFNSYGLDL